MGLLSLMRAFLALTTGGLALQIWVSKEQFPKSGFKNCNKILPHQDFKGTVRPDA
jgi:hypothetical protein